MGYQYTVYTDNSIRNFKIKQGRILEYDISIFSSFAHMGGSDPYGKYGRG
jgi:hypothetical protein